MLFLSQRLLTETVAADDLFNLEENRSIMKNSENQKPSAPSKLEDIHKQEESLEKRAATTKTDDSASKTKKEKLPYNPNVTEHDLAILQQDNIHGDGGDDQQLRNREKPVDFAGEDLDIPGREQARKWDERGLPDEENKLYSQGGENNDLEQDHSAL